MSIRLPAAPGAFAAASPAWAAVPSTWRRSAAPRPGPRGRRVGPGGGWGMAVSSHGVPPAVSTAGVAYVNHRDTGLRSPGAGRPGGRAASQCPAVASWSSRPARSAALADLTIADGRWAAAMSQPPPASTAGPGKARQPAPPADPACRSPQPAARRFISCGARFISPQAGRVSPCVTRLLRLPHLFRFRAVHELGHLEVVMKAPCTPAPAGGEEDTEDKRDARETPSYCAGLPRAAVSPAPVTSGQHGAGQC
jgi:hypothetical protein